VAVTDNPSIVAPVNETDNVIFLPFNDEKALEKCFKDQGNEIAAVIIRRHTGRGRYQCAEDAFLQKYARSRYL